MRSRRSSPRPFTLRTSQARLAPSGSMPSMRAKPVMELMDMAPSMTCRRARCKLGAESGGGNPPCGKGRAIGLPVPARWRDTPGNNSMEGSRAMGRNDGWNWPSVALTGASSGLGTAFALALARPGRR
ncbi:hypothetical protein RQ734_06940, partial [Roseomonas mucosa]|nr:hypothetical protein [Roseomonas mucosa]